MLNLEVDANTQHGLKEIRGLKSGQVLKDTKQT